MLASFVVNSNGFYPLLFRSIFIAFQQQLAEETLSNVDYCPLLHVTHLLLLDFLVESLYATVWLLLIAIFQTLPFHLCLQLQGGYAETLVCPFLESKHVLLVYGVQR